MLKLERTYILLFVLLLGIIFVIVFANFGRFKKNTDKIPDAAQIKKITFSYIISSDKIITKESDIKKIMALIAPNNIDSEIPSRGEVAGALYSIRIKYKDIFINDQFIVFYGNTINLVVPHKINKWYKLKTEVNSPMLNTLYMTFK